MPVFPIVKPLGLTSHDVVARVRRARSTKKVGHTGTLDPLAGGVLVVCVGSSTKLVQFMERDSKDYLAWISLGAATPTLDAEGPVEKGSAEGGLAGESAEAGMPGPAAVREALAQFVGDIQQVPPQYSAIQVGGVRAYAAARRGESIDLPARPVTIHSLELLGVYPSLSAAPQRFVRGGGGWRPAPEGADEQGVYAAELPPALGTFPTLLVRARVGSGTYLRSLARDVGAALGVPAHLSGLLRTRVGRYDLARAVPLDTVADAEGEADLDALTLPQVDVAPEVAAMLRQGKRPRRPEAGRLAVAHAGELVAVVDGDGETWRVVRAWA